jgi:hypothetical protein
MPKLFLGVLAAFVLLLLFGIARLIYSAIDWKLWPVIRRAKGEIKKLARHRYHDANVFAFGATEIDPRHLAIWITTKTDEQRDLLRQDQDFQNQLRAVLLVAGYPPAAIPLVAFAFESQETVSRDFGGNWYYATK